MTQMKPKFRISTLLWLTLAVACFFAGMSWDEFYERARLAMARKNVAANNVVVQAGTSVRISAPSKVGIHSITVDHPLLVSAILISSTQVQLAGKTAGTTTITLRDTNGVQTNYSVVVKPKATNFSSFVGIGR